MPLTHITRHIALADIDDARRVGHAYNVISVMCEDPMINGATWIYLEDRIDIDTNLYANTILQVALIMNQYIRANQRVLIHCHAGVNRSCSAIVAYLMKYRRMSLNDAVETIKIAKQRAGHGHDSWPTLTNVQFMFNLQLLEQYLASNAMFNP